MKFLEKYTGSLRSYRFLYVLFNYVNFRKLNHNRKLYKKYGLSKSIFDGISSKDFPKTEKDKPWLDKNPSIDQILSTKEFETFPVDIQNQILQWPNKGYLLLNQYFEDEKVNKVNAEIDSLLQEKEVDFNYTAKKIMFAFKKSEVIKDLVYKPELLKLLSFILGKEVFPFQTINFIKGSEQKAHSDSIHMTTYPQGYMIAAWIALEDTHLTNGPLFYYPGSHQLPYITNQDYDGGNTKLKIGERAYKKYEEKIEKVIIQNNLEKKDFYAKKGDVFVWHANLLHGGNPVINHELTRKSMVIHFYAKDVICFHEISERPSLIDNYPTSEVRVFDED